ncbi:MAG: rRNA pseudouridine synthase [Betaproteobacteria bacterium]|nr:rRNA pseudouridine synthase [Betaproteobacteria bacterium]
MTTLKLSKKQSDATVASSNKPPVRRIDPAKRDRSVAPAKKNTLPKADDTKQPAPSPATPQQQQRNRRHGGTPHKSHESDTQKQTTVGRSPSRPTHPEMRKSAITTRDRADRESAYRNPPRRGGKVRDGFVASEFDKNRNNKEIFSAKTNTSSSDLPRLSKVMAERGICSRREADEWITNGWVKVNGEIVETLGTRIDPNSEIVISSYAQQTQIEKVTIILHKPVGYVSGQAEDGYEPAVTLIHPDNQWPDDPELHQRHPKQFHRGMLRGLAPAGRLDIDSTGILVLTQDGRIARHLIGEDSTVEKEYLVRVTGELNDADLKRLNYGLSLDGEKLKPAKVSWQNEDQLRFVLREGKKRQIRRMCEMVGLHVIGLKRIRIGSITLGKLPVGQWRYLRDNERF